MKKILMSGFALALCASVIHAQIDKGSVLLGGNIGFSNDKAKDTSLKNNSVSVTPVAGIAVKQNLIVGISLSYGHSKNNLNSASAETEYKSYGAGIFVRKYVPLGKGFYFFGETGLNYQDYSNTYIYSSQKGELKGQNISIGLYPGISYAVSRTFHLEFGLPQLVALGYSKTEQLVNDATTQKTNGVNFNVAASSFSTLALGFRIFLPK